ncbi:uncharacterized protein LOC135700817 [Ochlerotatus camptorhynchus]|uniref:uncharacterized protein LOC135700817 n=1 Tax=Ochlerotatus camptorhynchus TaxID=644619 RepID=UPI0031DE16F6
MALLGAMVILPFVLLLVLGAAAFSSGAANHRRPVRSPPTTTTTCRYGDARDHYFQQPFPYGSNPEVDAYDLVDDDSPFPADKCRLAKEMEKEIQYLRRLMDKCERCVSSEEEMSTQLRGPNRKSVNCEDGGSSWCLSGPSPCEDTPFGSICELCQIGYDKNGSTCVRRAASCK